MGVQLSGIEDPSNLRPLAEILLMVKIELRNMIEATMTEILVWQFFLLI